MPESRTLSQLTSDAIARGGAWLLSNRRLMRAPIWLYRRRLGFLLGSRMLMLEHTGRTSGARRHVVLEVFGHPTPDTYLVASGFGGRSQWFRNVRANPEVRVSIGSHAPVPATARRLTEVEADTALAAYVRRYPRSWKRFKPVIEATLGSRINNQNTALPVVALHLDPARSRPDGAV